MKDTSFEHDDPRESDYLPHLSESDRSTPSKESATTLTSHQIKQETSSTATENLEKRKGWCEWLTGYKLSYFWPSKGKIEDARNQAVKALETNLDNATAALLLDPTDDKINEVLKSATSLETALKSLPRDLRLSDKIENAKNQAKRANLEKQVNSFLKELYKQSPAASNGYHDYGFYNQAETYLIANKFSKEAQAIIKKAEPSMKNIKDFLTNVMQTCKFANEKAAEHFRVASTKYLIKENFSLKSKENIEIAALKINIRSLLDHLEKFYELEKITDLNLKNFRDQAEDYLTKNNFSKEAQTSVEDTYYKEAQKAKEKQKKPISEEDQALFKDWDYQGETSSEELSDSGSEPESKFKVHPEIHSGEKPSSINSEDILPSDQKVGPLLKTAEKMHQLVLQEEESLPEYKKLKNNFIHDIEQAFPERMQNIPNEKKEALATDISTQLSFRLFGASGRHQKLLTSFDNYRETTTPQNIEAFEQAKASYNEAFEKAIDTAFKIYESSSSNAERT